MNRANQPHDIFNFESATALARLIVQDRLLSSMLGKPFSCSQSSHRRVIDVGCGTGGWAIDLARQFPRNTVIGIDDSPAMITYASDQARLHGLKNCQFKQMDVLMKQLPFPDQCFDLVNIRMMSTTIPRKMWPRLLEECHRITRTGGTLQLMECGGIATNSAALDEYSRFYALLLDKFEYGFSTIDGFGMAPHMGEHVLLQAGYQNITSQPFLLDFSAGTDWHDPQSQCIEAFCSILQPALIEARVTIPREIEKTYAALRMDLIQEQFQGFLSFPLICGERR